MSALSCTDITYSDRPAPEGTGFARCALKFLHRGTPDPRLRKRTEAALSASVAEAQPATEETLRPVAEKLVLGAANVRTVPFSPAPQYAWRALLPAHEDGGLLHG